MRLGDPACRLVTLVGPGGIGKTRLAVRAAAESERFQDGIYFVPLAGVASSDLLIPAMADALGLDLYGGESPLQQLLDALREKELLLLLDNGEMPSKRKAIIDRRYAWPGRQSNYRLFWLI